jgi:N6-adenosine-specific RNA methylase IME4
VKITKAQPVGLLRVEEAQKLLAACRRVDEAKSIKDKAEAIKLYLRTQRASREAVNDAGEITIWATRRMGELLEEQKRSGARASGSPGRPRKGSQAASLSRPPTLADLGLKHDEAARAQQLAKLPEAKVRAFIEEKRAEPRAEVTVSGLRREVGGVVRRQERVEKLVEIAKGDRTLPTGFAHYPVIYADPPWRYEHVETESRAIENQYPTMDLEAIKALPIADLATPDAVLFLWATSPKLAEAMEVVAAWGFAYRTSMCWVKRQLGMGYYARQRHELLLIATRGSPPTPAPANRPDSVITTDRTEHSAKPAEFAEAIERMYPELPRIELFCRASREGWAVWGNQAA